MRAWLRINVQSEPRVRAAPAVADLDSEALAGSASVGQAGFCRNRARAGGPFGGSAWPACPRAARARFKFVGHSGLGRPENFKFQRRSRGSLVAGRRKRRPLKRARLLLGPSIPSCISPCPAALAAAPHITECSYRLLGPRRYG
jgi:hypothetical protein